MTSNKPVVQALGVGGVFFRAKDPEGLAAWYERTLGIDQPGQGMPWMSEGGVTVFSPFEADSDYFGSQEQWAMINLRIADLDKAVDALAAAGVPLVKEVEEMEGIGRFAW
ncbi:MAG: VOC family protein, partial [Candidatus Thermoplasmatota archaeon]|nr:VOC family protein [Candidatus Thermoplasmatota archaeon]